jgi:hypothetical protein
MAMKGEFGPCFIVGSVVARVWVWWLRNWAAPRRGERFSFFCIHTLSVAHPATYSDWHCLCGPPSHIFRLALPLRPTQPHVQIHTVSGARQATCSDPHCLWGPSSHMFGSTLSLGPAKPHVQIHTVSGARQATCSDPHCLWDPPSHMFGSTLSGGRQATCLDPHCLWGLPSHMFRSILSVGPAKPHVQMHTVFGAHPASCSDPPWLWGPVRLMFSGYLIAMQPACEADIKTVFVTWCLTNHRDSCSRQRDPTIMMVVRSLFYCPCHFSSCTCHNGMSNLKSDSFIIRCNLQ